MKTVGLNTFATTVICLWTPKWETGKEVVTPMLLLWWYLPKKGSGQRLYRFEIGYMEYLL